MKVIICGAGQVGWQIARHLSGENNDVTVVDKGSKLEMLRSIGADHVIDFTKEDFTTKHSSI